MSSGFLNFAFLIVLLIGTTSLFFGFWLFFRWRRGRRSGTHPTCRACGFDLRGLAITADANSATTPPCPECGALLTGDAISKGDPRRSPFTLVVALVCLLIGLGIFTLGARRLWPTLTSRLPTPVLVAQSTIDRNDSIGTITELASRMGTKRMTADQANTLIERALDHQKNALVWEPAWGLIIENAHQAGSTTEVQWKRYLEVAATPFIDVSTKVAAGDPFTLDLGVKGCRVSDRGQLPMVNMSATANIDGVEVLPYKLGGGTFGLSRNGSAWSTYTANTAKVEPGERTLSIKVTAGIRDSQDDYKKPPRYSFEYIIKRPITVSPGGTATHTMKTDAALAEAMRKAIRVDQFDIEDGYQNGAIRASYMIYFEGLPKGVGMDIFLRTRQTDGTLIERKVGSVAREAQTPQGSHGMSSSGGDIIDPLPFVNTLRANDGLVDVIFRPNLQVAKGRPNLFEIWGDEILVPSFKAKIKLKAQATDKPSDNANDQAPGK